MAGEFLKTATFDDRISITLDIKIGFSQFPSIVHQRRHGARFASGQHSSMSLSQEARNVNNLGVSNYAVGIANVESIDLSNVVAITRKMGAIW